LRATNSAGVSEYSEVVKGLSLGDPDPVINLTGIAANDGTSIALSWTNPDNVLSLDLQRKDKVEDDYQSLVIFENVVQNSYEDTHVTIDTSYFYQIVSTNDIASVKSETLEITTPGLPSVPQNIETTVNVNGLGAKIN